MGYGKGGVVVKSIQSAAGKGPCGERRGAEGSRRECKAERGGRAVGWRGWEPAAGSPRLGGFRGERLCSGLGPPAVSAALRARAAVFGTGVRGVRPHRAPRRCPGSALGGGAEAPAGDRLGSHCGGLLGVHLL